MITVTHLSKQFKKLHKEPGIFGTLKSVLKREYRFQEALKPLSFELKSGVRVGLVGANGAGKTTLIKMLTGIVRPSAGQIDLNGWVPFEKKNAFKKQIGLVMGQKAQLWWDLPALDSFKLLKEIYEIPQSIYEEQKNELVKRLNLEHVLKTPLRQLSLGERMKLEIVASLLHRPKVLFLDEPTLGLDYASSQAIRNFLLEYSQKYQPTMLITSHYMEDIEILCNQLMILHHGSLIYQGSLSDWKMKQSRNVVMNIQLSTDQVSVNWASKGLSPLWEKKWERNLKIKVEQAHIHQFLEVLAPLGDLSTLTIEAEDIGEMIDLWVSRHELS